MQGGPVRPYFNKSIDQLEGLFALPVRDVNVFRSLEQGLQFRTTARAAKLLVRVREALQEQKVRAPITESGKTILQASQLQPGRSALSNGRALNDIGILL